ncbi:formyltransferase family protein [Bradyrhizobium sp. UFLA05-112]
MFEAVVLLTEAAEEVALSRILRSHRQDLTIRPVTGINELRSLEPSLLQQARLIAFASNTIVPADLLASLGYGAYNFHPGPPTYPGWAPTHFALYDRATEFGVTFHAMAERVDTGMILDVTSFPIPENTGVSGLCELTYVQLLKLFAEWADRLARQPLLPTPHPAIQWSGRRNSRRSYKAICDIPLDISRDELWRRMRIFGANHDGIAPTVNLHGVTFTATFPAESV